MPLPTRNKSDYMQRVEAGLRGVLRCGLFFFFCLGVIPVGDGLQRLEGVHGGVAMLGRFHCSCCNKQAKLWRAHTLRV